VNNRVLCAGAAALFALAGTASGQPLPPNFADQLVVGGWNQAVGVTFASDGRAFVWEKGGKVWLVENGIKAAAPLIDIGPEVGNWGDYGLIGFAVDPNFYTNGYIYLLYAVDYHYLKYFGTGTYNPNTSTDFHDTIGRLTRYTCNAAGGFRSVNLASRLILVGESMTTGWPLTHDSHGVGTVSFGEDGSLLAGCGDGATYVGVNVGGNQSGSSNTALTDGIITATENVGAYRAQLVNSLSGKIIRIDPATGNGLPSNPFFNAATPRAAKSRVWTVGVRNPFRWAIRPGSGNANQAAGDPGTLFIGDVGMDTHERLEVATTGGQNFGWPAFEGLDVHAGYWAAAPQNKDAPNPLSGGSCPAFFKFTSLIVPAITGTPTWPNPCNVSQQVPATIPRFMVRPPVLEWGHGHPVRVPAYSGGVLTPVTIESPQSSVQGFQFGGRVHGQVHPEHGV
jgi:glucose/arabinose dehydrogenase